MYTMEDFKNRKIVVRVDKKYLEKFLHLCEKEGFLWESGREPISYIRWGLCFHDVAIASCIDPHSNRRLVWCGVDAYERNPKIKIVGMKDFLDHLEPAPHTKYKITIESDGTTTTAHMEINGKQVKSTQAKLHPVDKFNFKTGAEMAFGRLWGSDKKKKQDFHIGDRVVCVREADGAPYFIGMHGTVRGVFMVNDNPFFKGTGYAVEFDKDCGHGHDCCECVPSKRGWVCNPSSLRHE